jgi:rhamnosyltransferase
LHEWNYAGGGGKILDRKAEKRYCEYKAEIMIAKSKLYGVVVWYNPTQSELNNIATYVNEIEKLFIVDNSTKDNAAMLHECNYPNVQYIPLQQNVGIATALNIACKLALKENAEWMLTMDQDSAFEKGGLEQFINEANTFEHQAQVGIFAPRYSVVGALQNNNPVMKHFKEEKEMVMMSGNLLNLSAYVKVGVFRDDFFIDIVDIEFCWRLLRQKYKIITVCNAILHHALGEGVMVTSFFGIKKYFDDHIPLRKYYLARNLLYMGKLHPQSKKYVHIMLLKQIKKVLFYDHRQKWTKLWYMLKGIRHYHLGISGKIIAEKQCKEDVLHKVRS